MHIDSRKQKLCTHGKYGGGGGGEGGKGGGRVEIKLEGERKKVKSCFP